MLALRDEDFSRIQELLFELPEDERKHLTQLYQDCQSEDLTTRTNAQSGLMQFMFTSHFEHLATMKSLTGRITSSEGNVQKSMESIEEKKRQIQEIHQTMDHDWQKRKSDCGVLETIAGVTAGVSFGVGAWKLGSAFVRDVPLEEARRMVGDHSLDCPPILENDLPCNKCYLGHLVESAEKAGESFIQPTTLAEITTKTIGLVGAPVVGIATSVGVSSLKEQEKTGEKNVH